MKKKPRKAVPGILKIGRLVEITDPAEQAELDRRCREAEKMLGALEARSRKAKPDKGR